MPRKIPMYVPNCVICVLGVSDERLVSADDTAVMDTVDAAVTSGATVPVYNGLPGTDTRVRDGDIGTLFYDDVIPIEYCVRVLTSKFLLSGYPQVG